MCLYAYNASLSVYEIQFCVFLSFQNIGTSAAAAAWPLSSSSDMPKINNIQVQCEKTHIRVNIDFDRPFFGVVFSKGHYSSPNCIHLQVCSVAKQQNKISASSSVLDLSNARTQISKRPSILFQAGSGTVSASFEVQLNQCGMTSSGNANSNGQPNPAGSFVESTIIVQVSRGALNNNAVKCINVKTLFLISI